MNLLDIVIGSDADTIVWWQMCIRATLIFFFGLILVRFGGKRVFGKNTSFDIVLGVILGSILSRALTANAKFLPTLAAAALLVMLHIALAKAAFHRKWFGHLIKGVEDQLVKDGRFDEDAMRKTSITPHDLKEAARRRGVHDLSQVQEAYLERSGKISIIQKR